MTDFLIQPCGDAGDWDLVIVDGDFQIVGRTEDTWPAELRQRIAYVLNTWYGESPFDRDMGFPWLESVFGKQPLEGISDLLYSRIAAIPGVDEITDPPRLLLDTETRVLNITVEVKSADFVVPVEVRIGGPEV